MWWPGADPYHNYNTADPTARMGYYGLNWVPYMAIDGQNDLNTNETTTTDWENRILSRASTSAPIELHVSGGYDPLTRVCSAMITILPEAGTSGEFTLQLALVEDDLYYEPSYQNYDTHQNVLRDMIPGAGGTNIHLEADIETMEQLSFDIPDELVVENCRLIGFVQAADHSVLNATTVDILAMPEPTIPLLSVLSAEMSLVGDDGDEKLSPGESVNYSVALENDCNWVDAAEAVGYLSCSNPFVSITDSVVIYGDIAACNSTSNTSDIFAFSVSENAPMVMELEFSLRLTANNQAGSQLRPYETTVPLIEKMDMFRKSYPVEVSAPLTSGNATIDLDGDGLKEVIVGGRDSLLHVFTVDGTELEGFPFAVGSWILGSPAVADLDQDGSPEIVISSMDKNIYVIQPDGTGTAIAQAGNILMGTPSLDDLDGDGDLEIVAGSFANEILVLHHDGTPYTGFPVILTGEIISHGVSIADLDGDGHKDLVVGTWKGFVHAYNLNGNSLVGFPVDVETGVHTTPVITDLNGDGTLEILVGQEQGKFFAISGSGDTLWTHQLSTARIRTAAAVCDFDRNGLTETVFTTLDGGITVLDYQGHALPGWPQNLGGGCYSSPVIADLDGDRLPEIIVGTNSAELAAYHFDGSLVENFPIALSSQAQGTPTVADLNDDGLLEIILGTDFDLSIVNIKIPSVVGSTWFTALGNFQRTGFFNTSLLSTGNETVIPGNLELMQNYPNPFNSSTTLEFGIPEDSFVSLTIYDALGQEVRQLLNAVLSSGNYSMIWNGLDQHGRAVETGIYFAKINVINDSKVVKMILMK